MTIEKKQEEFKFCMLQMFKRKTIEEQNIILKYIKLSQFPEYGSKEFNILFSFIFESIQINQLKDLIFDLLKVDKNGS